ncbi:MAG: alpha/beta hydrolase [Alteromonadaceae bacterium]|uniref:YheT family hydrolase n=1 Tax=Marinobacter sp. BGYM27 TaxID=2975597 RepID=UPI000C554104|nr:alpha/beta fold hydrolase [Marinobacter sp. BGYM27]MAA65729.1 alpha/beta hydrolase [Alteromonadaceae bacterium]MBH86084.1 alpha/beta hydrolase [Alteromonadaceae bacterium]MDG5498869.1 alpha/beta fold hydrolase [Marinobacter sp. BGYM27]|tara:strand:- start:13511 stop:14518 length:1008 start_codon:yes stop_codon:yes gene_type:complete
MKKYQSEPQPVPAAVSATGTYRPPLWLRNGHLQSVWPSLFRRVELAAPQSETLQTSDQDELHLDWYRQGSGRLAIISHGLEGHSRRPYVLGLAKALIAQGWDVLAWNFRSCGGVMNKQPRFYHSGATVDLAAVVQHALGASDGYQHVALSGFSMGGNLTLLYLAEQGEHIDPRIRGAVAFSVPCDLAGSAAMLALPSRRIYMKRFLDDLHEKMKTKAVLFPERIDVAGFEAIRNFREFDNRYTAPLHGFRDAEDYWEQSACLHRLKDIRVPALMVNAQDDPFLSSSCFPGKREILGPCVKVEAPKWGGHVGFVELARDGYYWSERRAVRYLDQLL